MLMLENTTEYKVFFPGSINSIPGPLNQGKDDFVQLNGITINDWDGMKNSIEIHGVMNDDARKIFLRFQDDAFQGYMPQLWSFQFHDNQNRVLIRVEDFTVCLCWFSDDMIHTMEQKGLLPSEDIEPSE